MVKNNKKKFREGYEEWSMDINKLAKNVPDDDTYEECLEKAVQEFECEWDNMPEGEKKEMRRAIEKADALAKGIDNTKTSRRKKVKKHLKSKSKEMRA